jgi:hypothetical protein
MLRIHLAAIGAVSLVLSACHAPVGPESPADILPLQHVRLYETGVGYFERSGTLSNTSGSLPVPASHVDDALKTVLVLAEGGTASVSGIEFSSILSQGMARSLAALPLDADRAVSYRDVLDSMKGLEVELVSAGKKVRGKLVEVVRAPPIPIHRSDSASGKIDDEAEDDDEQEFVLDTEDDLYVTILTAEGAVHRYRASRLTSIRPTDRAFSERLGAAVGAISGRAAQIRRTLRVHAKSSTPVRLGYIAETPVWRATYRLVLEPGRETAVIQGWALLHNDTDEQWHSVNVELVNGRPDSFLFPLSAPRYTRRPLAEPAETMSTVPQLADKTADQIWGDHADMTGGSGSASGYGSGYGRLAGSHRSQAPRMRAGATYVSGTRGPSSEISIGNLAAIEQATGSEDGALFRYRLARALDLRAHGSALVPFTQGELKVRRLTWFGVNAVQGRSAVRLVNTTRQTLPAGPIAVYERHGFAGETGVARLKPKEGTILQFGVDLDAELEVTASESQDDLQRVRLKKGFLVDHFVRHHEREYQLTNRSGRPRVVFVELDIVKNAKVQGADQLDYDHERRAALAVFLLPPRDRVTRTLRLDEALEQSMQLEELSSELLLQKAEAQSLPQRERDILRSAALLLAEVEKSNRERSELDGEQTRLEEDVKRMREHLAALGDKSGSPAGANPLVARILQLEDALSQLRRQLETLDQEQSQKLGAVADELEKLNQEAA